MRHYRSGGRSRREGASRGRVAAVSRETTSRWSARAGGAAGRPRVKISALRACPAPGRRDRGPWPARHRSGEPANEIAARMRPRALLHTRARRSSRTSVARTSAASCRLEPSCSRTDRPGGERLAWAMAAGRTLRQLGGQSGHPAPRPGVGRGPVRPSSHAAQGAIASMARLLLPSPGRTERGRTPGPDLR